jgi:hypothetical protein
MQAAHRIAAADTRHRGLDFLVSSELEGDVRGSNRHTQARCSTHSDHETPAKAT